MKINWDYIKIIAILLVMVGLYAFSKQRNNKRLVSAPKINFSGDDNLYITYKNVSNLLIQNQDTVKNVPKEILDLNQLEARLNANAMVRSSEVYLGVNGQLTADIEQKTPIARVHTNASYYIDSRGEFMPLSQNYTARVPLVTGDIDKKDLENVYVMATKVYNDEFLKQHVIEISQTPNKTIELRLRKCNFIVHIGNLNMLDKKVNNLKAFYKKALKDQKLNVYSKVNLQFDNQVVCTKF